VLAIDRAGLVGADGPTHAGSFDLSFLRCVPNMLVMAPSDENECRQMLYTAFMHNGPSAVRYPRGGGTGVAIQQEMQALTMGKGESGARAKKSPFSPSAACLHPHWLRPKNSRPRSPTCASSSRWTRS